MLAQQRAGIVLRPQPSGLAAYGCRGPVYRVVMPSMRLTVCGSAQHNDVSIIVPAEQPLSPVTATEKGFGVGKACMLAAAALAVGFVVSKLKKRSDDMGYTYYSPGRNDPFMSGVMKNVNTVQMEELSPDIIAAARARRSRERANHRLDLEDIELPENHPWATRKPMSHEQEAAIAQRLQVRPRPSQRGPGGAEPRGRVRQQNRDQ